MAPIKQSFGEFYWNSQKLYSHYNTCLKVRYLDFSGNEGDNTSSNQTSNGRDFYV